jgi:basic amino acid/polyamine antiporter, APA family
MAVSVVLCAMVPYYDINLNAPLAFAFSYNNNSWAAKIVAIGAATTLSATTFASLLGQPRIFLQMARDVWEH